jgi:prepilin-type N-terminal cleavage/methylation domain-containing protein
MHTERNVARRAGFTLVELLVVIAIIAVLAGMLTPALIGAMTKAREANTRGRIQQIETAATAFFNDHGDYPPSRWDELDDIFKYDPNGDGQYDTFVYGAGAGELNGNSNPSTVNEGIEVLFACLATRNGGVYLDTSKGDWLRNVDYDDMAGDFDTDNDDVAKATNWFIAPNTSAADTPPNPDPIFELTDWWGNALVYFHNREYANHDGYDASGAAEDPEDATGEYVYYVDVEGKVLRIYARSDRDNTTGNYPNLSTFQLFSLGHEGSNDLTEHSTVANVYYMKPTWTKKTSSRILTNWEE